MIVTQNTTHIGGSVTGSAVVTGNNNTTVVRFESITLPPAETVDISAALVIFEQAIATLNLPEKGKIERALTDAREETGKSEPDKAEVAQALERVGTWTKKAADFADNAKKIADAAAPVVAWLGPAGAGLGKMLGLL